MKARSLCRKSIPAVLVVMVLALTGCSSSDGDAKKAEVEESPLQKYMSVLWGDEQDREEAYAKQKAKAEELIAACMAKEGFEYTPDTQDVEKTVVTPSEEDGGPGPGFVEYAKTSGYGITDRWGEMMRAPQGTGEVMGIEANQNHMSPEEMQAYNETLWGAGNGRVEEDEEDTWEYDWTKSGCNGAAFHETQSPGADAYEDPEFKDLFAKMDEMNMQTVGDGETPAPNEEKAKLDREWVECMGDAGYEYTDMLQPENELSQEWMEMQNSAVVDESGVYKQPSEADLEKQKKAEKKFRENEIKIAVIDAKCREKIDYVNEEKRITHELEQKFVEENRVQLDTMLAKYGMKKKSK